MKINPVSNVVGQYAKLKAYATKETPASYMGTDQLELSEQARLFTEALAAAKRNAQMSGQGKQEKIETLKSMIADGSYEVSTGDLLKKIFLG